MTIGNAATEIWADRNEKGTLQADGSIRTEPLMDVAHVADTVAQIVKLPNSVTVLQLTIM